MKTTKMASNHLITVLRKTSVVLIMMVLLILFTGTCFAAGELPSADVFKPDTESFTSAQVIIKVLAWVAGILASVYFAVGIVKIIIKDVKEILNGDADLKTKQPRFIAVGAAFIILLLVITGKWYDVVSVVWNKIVLPLINSLGK